MVKPQNNFIPLHVVNTTLTPVTIYKGSTVADAECVDELISVLYLIMTIQKTGQ